MNQIFVWTLHDVVGLKAVAAHYETFTREKSHKPNHSLTVFRRARDGLMCSEGEENKR